MSGPRIIDLAPLPVSLAPMAGASVPPVPATAREPAPHVPATAEEPARRASAHNLIAGSAAEGRAGEAELLAAIDGARLVCFPTDTVYGIGGLCRPGTYEAIWAAKGREPDKPLQVVFPTLDLLLAALLPGPELRTALGRLLPGPVTLVLPYPDGFDGPPAGRSAAGAPTLGVRVPAWPPAARAMARLPWPLVASSANLSGAPPARRLADLSSTVGAACDLLLDGGEVRGIASTVVDLAEYASCGRWRLLRDGALGRAALVRVLGQP
jgi:L-threonylcarbamoyladenylate synthase